MRRSAERAGEIRIGLGVNTKAKTIKAHDRAARLHREANNCLTIAVGERDGDHAAALIDEAVKLAKRSRELAGE